MEAARVPALPLRRFQLALIGALLALAALAWLVTDNRMVDMDAGPGTDPGALGFYLVSWLVMMGAMMFPSIAPMVLVFERIQSHRQAGNGAQRAVSTWVFVAGYLLAWTSFGGLAYGIVEGIRSLSIDALAWDRGGQWLTAGVLVAAAGYQLTPLKDACLTRCRGPFEFLTERWREGKSGALLMGVEHGAWCVGCCWALMAALFALGVMSIFWMVFVAGLIAIEKTLPWKRPANRGIAIVLLALGIGVAASPDDVPGLTVPGSPEAESRMMRMDPRPTDAMPSAPMRSDGMDASP
jgi:predicted metal-binding membrane protein